MIEANELRLRNWVLYKGHFLQVDSLLEYTINIEIDVTIGINYADLQPIPLTPELLLDIGFEEKHGDYQFGDFKIYSGHHEFWFWYKTITNTTKEVELKFLHQLQNLYFNLKGEELKIQFPINSLL
jgi:hypothetical protein